MTRAIRKPILEKGSNCWRNERADRFAFIVDAADYFVAVKSAILQARHSVYLIGWDFDTRIKFEPEHPKLEGPNVLGQFLRWIERERPDIDVYVLKWDLGFLQDVARGALPILVLDWMTGSRIHLKLDHCHPPGAAHHQKIAVIDDVVAFCGGIDMTADRWDTPSHRDRDPRRVRPSGRAYGPWHDAACLVDGPVARALGELARERWSRAIGETLEPPPRLPAIWPEMVEPLLRDVDVAIARTAPEHGGKGEAREIEALHLDAIASAQDSIYCESQYFASRAIAEAMARRLQEPDGPDIVVVNPNSADGWLEAAAMDTARAKLLAMVRKADAHGRFRIFTPVTGQGNPIYVHAKVMIVDDRFFRAGSANFNNRSMGFDTECDLAIEARDGSAGEAVRDAICAIRKRLLAEHLGLGQQEVASALEEFPSFAAAIDSMLSTGRSLRPYEPDDYGPVEEAFATSEFVDPERPPKLGRKLKRAVAGAFQPLGRLGRRIFRSSGSEKTRAPRS